MRRWRVRGVEGREDEESMISEGGLEERGLREGEYKEFKGTIWLKVAEDVAYTNRAAYRRG